MPARAHGRFFGLEGVVPDDSFLGLEQVFYLA